MNFFLKKVIPALLGAGFLLKVQYVLVPNVLGAGLLYNEYLDVSLYFFDICFFMGLLYILRNESNILSSIRELFHVKHTRSLLLIPLLILILSTLSISFAYNKTLSLRQLVFLFQGVTLYYGIIYLYVFHVKQKRVTVPCETVPEVTGFTVMLEGILGLATLNAIVAITQFILQKDLSLNFLGESHLQVGAQNIATINILGAKVLRSYGLFPHPNILAAFLLLAVTVYVLFKNDFVSRDTIIKISPRMFHVKQVQVLIIACALMVTFSKIAILLALILCMVFVPRETGNRLFKKMFHVKQIILLISLLFTILFYFNQKSFTEREFSLLQYVHTNPISLFGNGIGSSYLHQSLHLQAKDNPWLVQPAHSGYLIILSEVGLLGLFLYVYLILNLLTVSSVKRVFHVKQKFSSGILVFFVTVLAAGDHYFVTLPQGAFLFWIFLSLGSVKLLIIDKNINILHN
jgi:hypothetical protein